VYENLLLGAYTIRDEKQQQTIMEFILDLFPRLAERRKQLAGTLSGGERKMLAIARGMMSNPDLLLSMSLLSGWPHIWSKTFLMP